MKTKDLPKVDILHHPFLAVSAEDCVRQFYKSQASGNTSDCVIVSEHDFLIVSETKKSKRIIIFDDAKNFGKNITKENILRLLKWKDCFLWTGGALKLMIRDDDPTFLDLIISKDRDYALNPNISVCRPFVYKILKHLQKFHNASPDEGICFVECKTEGLDSGSFCVPRVQEW